MTSGYLILGMITIGGAIGAMNFGRLVHCALSLVAAFAGLAGIYLQLNAWFLGLAQVLVYVGAVAILIVFALLLTRNAESGCQNEGSRTWPAGVAVALMVFLLLAGSIANSSVQASGVAAPENSVEMIGRRLMTIYVVPLEALALLLTTALLGAMVIARGGARTERSRR
jgi:NADH-quinone oxidoreductase subunit J